MKCLSLLIAAWGISLFAVADNADEASRLTASFGLALYTVGAESDSTASRLAGTEISLNLAYPLLENLSTQLNVGAVMETGSFRSRYSGEFRPRQGVRLRNAFAAWNATSWLKFYAGSIDQDRWESPALVAKQSFPSLLEQISLDFSAWTVSLSAQQSWLNDLSTLQPYGNWPAGTSSFALERLTVEFRPSNFFRLSSYASHYLFDNLAAPAAYEAQFLGNSIEGVSPTANRFAYAFQGFEWGGKLQGDFTNWVKPWAKVSWLSNRMAPVGARAGRSIALGNESHWGANKIIKARVEFFELESDVVPALFNDQRLGHTNRKGWLTGVAFAWPQSAVEVSADYVDARNLNQSSVSSDLQWFQFQLRANYNVL